MFVCLLGQIETMNVNKTKKSIKRKQLKAVLKALSERNGGVIANMSRKHLEAIEDGQLDGVDAHNFVKELHEQVKSEYQRNGTFEPEIVELINNYSAS